MPFITCRSLCGAAPQRGGGDGEGEVHDSEEAHGGYAGAARGHQRAAQQDGGGLFGTDQVNREFLL